MKRTDADGHDTNRFTDGDPAMGIEATVVDETWLNNVQEEICNVIEAAGITLNGADEDQLLEALGIIGQAGPISTNFTIANGQVVAANVTGVVFDKDDIRAVKIPFSIHRQTDTPVELDAYGHIYLWYKPLSGSWQISVETSGDDHGVTFTVTAGGQLQYVSTNEAGANYAGSMRIAGIQQILV